MLVIKRIHVRYQLTVPPDAPVEKIDRVMGFYRDHCPVYRSIKDSIAFSDEIEVIKER